MDLACLHLQDGAYLFREDADDRFAKNVPKKLEPPKIWPDRVNLAVKQVTIHA